MSLLFVFKAIGLGLYYEVGLLGGYEEAREATRTVNVVL